MQEQPMVDTFLTILTTFLISASNRDIRRFGVELSSFNQWRRVARSIGAAAETCSDIKRDSHTLPALSLLSDCYI